MLTEQGRSGIGMVCTLQGVFWGGGWFFLSLSLDPFLPHVRAHSSHISTHSKVFFFVFCFLSLDPFLPYVRAHSSHIST